jgi:voltage-gated potassium channel
MLQATWELLTRAFHNRGSRAHTITETVIYVLIAISLVILALDVTSKIPAGLASIFSGLDRVILVVFGVEYALRILTFRPPVLNVYNRGKAWRIRKHITGRLRYALRPMMLIDLLTVLALVPALRALRAVRLFRLIRTFRLFRYSDPFLGIARGFQENSVLYAGIFSLFGMTVLVGGVTLYLTEFRANPDVSTLADGLWWTIVTLTTVGYGDISPATSMGRIIGAILMVAGMFSLALFAGIVGNSLLQAILNLRNESFRMSNTTDHIVVCGYHEGVHMLLRDLRREVGEEGDILIFHPEPRPGNLPPSYHWVNGDPARESEIAKARVGYARSVIVVASRDLPPQQADARTILICFTIRSYLKNLSATADRERPVHLACEILEEENMQHAELAGADDIVDTSRLGFSLLSRAVFSHGSAASISEVAEGHGDRFYIRDNPFGTTMLYGDLSRQMLTEHGTHTFGVYHTRRHHLDLGPSDELEVEPEDKLVVLTENDGDDPPRPHVEV